MRKISILWTVILLTVVTTGFAPKWVGQDLLSEGPRFVGGNLFVDVDLSTLGDDIIAGEYWTPVVDFSTGTKYYFDPSAAVSGIGTLESPFRSLGWEIYDDRVIERRASLGGAVENPGAVVGANDVCVLLSGDHGKIQFNRYYFDGHLGIVGAPSETAKFGYIKILRGNGFYFENIDNVRRLRTDAFWDSPGSSFDDAPWYVSATLDTVGNGVVDNIIFHNMNIATSTKSAADAWTDEEWTDRVMNGITVARGSNIHFQGVNGEVIANALRCNGDTSTKAKFANFIENDFEYVSGDFITSSNTDSTYIYKNRLVDVFCKNADHVDLMQLFGSVNNLIVDSNHLYESSTAGRLIPGDGETYGGVNYTSSSGDNVIFSNNIVYANVASGIKFGGTDTPENVYCINNTVFGDYTSVQGTAGITVTTAQGSLFIGNNISGYIRPVGDFAGVEHGENNVYVNDFSTAGFTSFVNDGPPLDQDLTLLPSSENVDAGTMYRAPAVDFAGVCRPYGSEYDIGAYEYNDGGSCPEAINILADSWNIGGPGYDCWNVNVSDITPTYLHNGVVGDEAVLLTGVGSQAYSTFNPASNVFDSTGKKSLVISVIIKPGSMPAGAQTFIKLQNTTISNRHQMKVEYDAAGVATIDSIEDIDANGLNYLGDGFYRAWYQVDLVAQSEVGDDFELVISPWGADGTANNSVYFDGIQLEWDVPTVSPYQKTDCP